MRPPLRVTDTGMLLGEITYSPTHGNCARCAQKASAAALKASLKPSLLFVESEGAFQEVAGVWTPVPHRRQRCRAAQDRV